MSRKSTYRDARQTQRYTSDGVVQEYMNPRSAVGCSAHGKTSCLCDVVVTSPVEIVKVPQQFAWVENAHDLTAVAADLWARLDVTPEDAVPSKNKWQPAREYEYIEKHTDEQLRHFAQLVADGMSHKQLEELCGVSVPSSCFKIMRNAAGFHTTAQKRRNLPNKLIVEMGNAGATAGEIRDRVMADGEPHVKHQTIKARYMQLTGKKLRTVRKQSAKISRERVAELWDQGKSRKEIRAIMSEETGWPVGLTTIQRAVLDVLEARDAQ